MWSTFPSVLVGKQYRLDCMLGRKDDLSLALVMTPPFQCVSCALEKDQGSSPPSHKAYGRTSASDKGSEVSLRTL